MPAWRANGLLGVKVVSVFPGNGARGLASVSASYLLCDGATGAAPRADRWRRDHPAPHRRGFGARRIVSGARGCRVAADRRLRPCRRTDGRGVSRGATDRAGEVWNIRAGRRRTSCGADRGRGGDRSGRRGAAGRYRFMCNLVARAAGAWRMAAAGHASRSDRRLHAGDARGRRRSGAARARVHRHRRGAGRGGRSDRSDRARRAAARGHRRHPVLAVSRRDARAARRAGDHAVQVGRQRAGGSGGGWAGVRGEATDGQA